MGRYGNIGDQVLVDGAPTYSSLRRGLLRTDGGWMNGGKEELYSDMLARVG